MAILQDSFAVQRGIAYKGALERAHGNTINSGTVEGSTTLRMGHAAITSTDSQFGVEELRDQPGTVTFAGVAVRQFGKGAFTADQVESNVDPRYNIGQTADLVVEGRVAVRVEADVVRGQQAAVATNGEFTLVTASGARPLPGAHYVTGGAADSIVMLDLSGVTYFEAANA